MVQALGDTDEFHSAGIGPVSRPRVVMLLGGLRELTAITVEDGGRMSDITGEAAAASVAPRRYGAGERPPLVAGGGGSTRGGATFARPVDAGTGAFGRVADDVVQRVVGPLVGLLTERGTAAPNPAVPDPDGPGQVGRPGWPCGSASTGTVS